MLTKVTVERTLNAELDDALSTINTSLHPIQTAVMATPVRLYAPKADNFSSIQAEIVKALSSQALSKRAKLVLPQWTMKFCFYMPRASPLREIVKTFKELYGADASPSLISKVTDAVIEQVVEWQSRELDAVYPIVYLDCIVLKIRQDKHVNNKAVYLALGVNMEALNSG